MRRDIVFLGSEDTLPAVKTLSLQMGGKFASLPMDEGSTVEADCHVVVMADLSDLSVVRHVRNALSTNKSGCRIFMVEPSSRVTQVHANVLGAHRQLDAPISPTEIGDVIAAYESERGQQGTDQAIDSGFLALRSTFRGMTERSFLDSSVLLDATTQIAKSVSLSGIDSWLNLVRRHHPGTFQHCMLVTGVAAAFGAGTGMCFSDVAKLTTAALLHDIGKAAVAVEILDKTTTLTPGEVEAIRTHPQAGFDYLRAHSELEPDILSSVLHHHEYLDGSGYPKGLVGTQIDDITRGFAAAVWTHAIYDVWVLVFHA